MKPRTLNVVTLHGIGTPKPNYANKAMARLSKGLSRLGFGLNWRSVHYDPILEAAAQAFERDQGVRGRDNQRSTKIVDHTLADALAGKNSRVQERIFGLIDEAYMKLRSDDVVFIGHSMGCSHAIDYLNSRQLVRCSQLVTMANNSPLWYLGVDYPVPRQIRPGAWTNIIDRDDALGAFMAGVTKGAAVDLEVKLGGWLSWMGAAHTAYWNDKELFEKTLPRFLTL